MLIIQSFIFGMGNKLCERWQLNLSFWHFELFLKRCFKRLLRVNLRLRNLKREVVEFWNRGYEILLWFELGLDVDVSWGWGSGPGLRGCDREGGARAAVGQQSHAPAQPRARAGQRHRAGVLHHRAQPPLGRLRGKNI